MLNIIYSEFLKLRKSYIISISSIGGVIMSAVMALANLTAGITMSFEKFAGNIQQMNLLMLNGILFSLISGYVFSREFTDKTASIVYTYPVSRMKIFMSKLFTVYMIIFLVYFIQCISTYLSYYVANSIVPSSTLIVNDIKANIVSMLFQFLLISIPILIANITKNIMMPVVYGVLSLISLGFIGMDSPYIDYFPLAAPYISAKYFYLPRGINFNHMIIPSILCFVLFITICIYEFNKKDID